jgi:hypothetical protein
MGIVGGALVAVAVGLTARAPADSKYMKVEEVKPGMKGWGLTVFSGEKPEKFDVEIISTLNNFRPGQSLFLIKTLHPKLQIAKTVAGMSGSPIYIGDKLIGAYAYGWFFNVEPIAGVTPIENMLADMRRPIPKELMPGPVALGPLPASAPKVPKATKAQPKKTGMRRVGKPSQLALHKWRGRSLDYDMRKHATQVAERTSPALSPPNGMGLRPATTDIMVGGLGPETYKLASELLEPLGMTLLQAGGGGRKAKPAENAEKAKYVDGGVITVELVRGDISLSGLGTVTHVVGQKLVAFGHPMLAGGIENLPTATGNVHWILSTQNRSFKIGEPVTPLGSLVNDRQASIVVDTSFQAPVFPLKLTIDGAVGFDKKVWNMEVSQDQFLAPTFAAIGIGSALETVASERVDLTWRAVSKLTVEGHGTMQVEDFGAGRGSPLGPSDIARSRLVRALGALYNNPWKTATIGPVEMKMKITMKQETFFLRGAQLLESEIDAGEKARVRLTLQPHMGETQTRIVEVPIPRTLAGQTVRIKLEPGYQADRAVPAPESFEELVEMLPKLDFPGESLIASYRLENEAGAAYRGHLASRLPAGAVDMLRSNTQSVAPEVYGAEKQVVIPFKGFIVGQDTVEVKVREVLR